MPDNQRTIRVDLGLEDAKETLRSISSTVSDNLQTIGQVAAFGGLAYGGYRAMTTPGGQDFAQGAGSLAMNASEQIRDAAGMAPIGATASNRYMFEDIRQGFTGAPAGLDYGINVRPAAAAHYGARDAAQRVVSGATSAMGGTGMTYFGTGAIRTAMNATGIMPGLSALGKSAGSGIGSAAMGAPFNIAGSAAQSFLPDAIGGPLGGALGQIGQGASTVGEKVGGIAGGIAPHFGMSVAINSAIRTITDQMANQIGIEGEIDNVGYMFTPGDLYTNQATRRGFGQRELGSLAASAREDLVGERFLRQEDFSEIFGTTIRNDLMFDVRGAEEFEERFTDMVENIRDVTRIFETSLEEAGELIGEMQRSGVYGTSEQIGQLIQADAIGRLTGYTGSEIVGMRAQGAEQASQMGFNRLLGGELSEFGLLGIEGALQGMTSREQQEFQETMQDVFGGREGAADFMGQSLLRGTINQQSGYPATRALHGMVDLETGQFDPAMLRQYAEGEVGLNDLLSQATTMGSIDPSFMRRMHQRPQDFASQLSGPELMTFLQRFVQEMDEEWMDGILDPEDIISDMTGVRDPRQLEIITTALMEGHNVMDMDFIEEDAAFQLARERGIEDRMPRGRFETIRHGFERLGHTIGSPFVNLYRRGMEDIEDFYHEQVLGIDQRQIFDYDNIDLGYAPGRGGIEGADRLTERELGGRLQEMGLDDLVRTDGGFGGVSETVQGLTIDGEDMYAAAFDDSFRAQVSEVVRGRIDRENLDWTREQEQLFDAFQGAWGDMAPRSQIRNIEEAFGLIERSGRSTDDAVYREALRNEMELFGYGAVDEGYIPVRELGGLTAEQYYEQNIIGAIDDDTTTSEMIDIFLGNEYMREYMEEMDMGHFSTIASMYPEIGRSITSWDDLSEEQRESMQEMGFSESDFTRGVGPDTGTLASELFGEDVGRVIDALLSDDIDDIDDLDREVVRLLSDLVDEDVDELKQILEDNTDTFERLMLENILDEDELELAQVLSERDDITNVDQLIDAVGEDTLERIGLSPSELREGELASRIDRSLIGQVMTGELTDIHTIRQHEDFEELEAHLASQGLTIDDLRSRGTVRSTFIDREEYIQQTTEADLGEDQLAEILEVAEGIYGGEYRSWEGVQERFPADSDGDRSAAYYGLVDFLGIDEESLLDQDSFLEWVQRKAFGEDYNLINQVIGAEDRTPEGLRELLGDDYERLGIPDDFSGQTADSFLIDFVLDRVDIEGVDQDIVSQIRSGDVHDWESLAGVVDEDILADWGITEETFEGEDIESFEDVALDLIRQGFAGEFSRVQDGTYDINAAYGSEDYYRELMRGAQESGPRTQEEALIELTNNLNDIPELLEMFDGDTLNSLIQTLDANESVLNEIKERL